MRARWIALAAALSAPVACNAILGAGEPVPASVGGGGGATSSMTGGNAGPGSSSGGAGQVGGGGSGGTGASGGGCASGEVCVGKRGSLVEKGGACASPVSYFACEDCACGISGAGSCSPEGAIGSCGSAGSTFGDTIGTCTDAGGMQTITAHYVAHEGSFTCASAGSPPAAISGSYCPVEAHTSCGLNEVCVPKTACVVVDASASCPANYTVRSAIVSGATSATCSCACEPCADVPIEVHGDPGCAGSVAYVTSDDACVDVGFPIHSITIPSTADATCDGVGTPVAGDGDAKILCCPGP